MHGRSARCSTVMAWLLVVLSAWVAPAGEPPAPRPEELLPEQTIAALVVPNLSAAREAAGKLRLAEMLAQPEMQSFLQPPLARMGQIYREVRARVHDLPALEDFSQGLLDGELAVGVVARQGPGRPLGVVVIFTPKDREAFGRAAGPFVGGRLPPEGEVQPLGVLDDASAYAWAQGRFVFCSPQTDLEGLLKRVEDPAARAKGSLSGKKSFAQARAAFASPVGWLYAEPRPVADLIVAAQGMKAGELAQVKALLKHLGVENLTALVAGVSFAGGEPVFEAHLSLADPRARTILTAALGGPAPLAASSLKIAAADAPYICAFSCDVAGFLPALRAFLEEASPQSRAAELNAALTQLNARLGFDLEKDFLQNLGSEVVVTETVLDTSLPLLFLPGLVASVPVKDAAKVEACLAKLKDAVAGIKVNGPVRVEIRQVAHAGKTVYYPALPGSGVPPALCVAGDRLLIGTSVNAVRRGLDQLAQATDILSNKEFQETLSRLTGQPFDAQKLPPGFSYAKDYSSGSGMLVSAGGTVFILSAFLGGVLESTGQEPAAQGLEQVEEEPLAAFYSRPAGKVVLDVLGRLDLGLWPDEGFFQKYRRAHGTVSQWMPDGLHVRMELPPPLPGLRGTGSSPLVMIGAASVGAGLLLPVLARAREQARRTSSANNMRQMTVACHLYADVPANNGKFPKDPAELCPDYVRDLRVFTNPRFGDADVGYIYLPGSTPEMPENIVFIEAIPEHQAAQGRNAAFGDGHVEWLDEQGFEAQLEKTEKALKAAGVELKPFAISVQALKKKQQP